MICNICSYVLERDNILNNKANENDDDDDYDDDFEDDEAEPAAEQRAREEQEAERQIKAVRKMQALVRGKIAKSHHQQQGEITGWKCTITDGKIFTCISSAGKEIYNADKKIPYAEKYEVASMTEQVGFQVTADGKYYILQKETQHAVPVQ